MVRVYVTKKAAKVIKNLRNDKKYFEVMAFMANVQEATIEARSYLTQEQGWDLFSAIQDFKCLLDELADYKKRDVPVGIHLYMEDEVGELK